MHKVNTDMADSRIVVNSPAPSSGIPAQPCARGVLAAAVAALALAAAPAATAGGTFRDGDVAVFYGDSITHGGAYILHLANYYLSRFPDRDIRFVNSGSGGDVAWNAATEPQIEERVFERTPTTLSIMFGMNDCTRFDFGPEPTEAQVAAREGRLGKYRRSLHAIVTNVQARCGDIPLYLLSPHPWDDNSRIFRNKNPEGARYPEFYGKGAAMGRFAEAVREEAEATPGATFVDNYATVGRFYRERRQANPETVFASDRTHPDLGVHLVMATAFLQAQNAPQFVSDVAFQGTNVLKAVNAEVSGIARGEDGSLAFTLLERALPWTFRGDILADATNRAEVAALDQEILAFYGLEEGGWTLLIDGRPVATASAWEWENGVDLAFNPKTPQYVQSQKALAALAAFWSETSSVEATQSNIRRHASRQMRAAGLDPDSAEDRAKFLAEQELKPWDVKPWTLTFENWERLDEMRAENFARWPEVRAAFQPGPHRYELRKEDHE